MGLKTRPASDRPTSHCLRGWWWDGDGDRDHSLYDRDGLTLARVVLGGDGRYRLRTPIAIPRQRWPHLEEAKRGAESIALAIPMETVEPKLDARIKRDKETPHPSGRPRGRTSAAGDGPRSSWGPPVSGAGVP